MAGAPGDDVDGRQVVKVRSMRGPLLMLVTLVLCLPVVRLVLDGQVGATAAAERAAVGIAIAWVGIGGISRMVDGYRRRNGTVPSR